jgi:hypothetical protein
VLPEQELHGTKSQNASIIDNAVKASQETKFLDLKSMAFSPQTNYTG